MRDDGFDLPESRLIPINGKTIHFLRSQKKISRQTLADRVSVTKKAVENWENGKTKSVYRKTLSKIADALGVHSNLLSVPPDVVSTELLVNRPKEESNFRMSRFTISLHLEGDGIHESILEILTDIMKFNAKINTFNNGAVRIENTINMVNISEINNVACVCYGELQNRNFFLCNLFIKIDRFGIFLEALRKPLDLKKLFFEYELIDSMDFDSCNKVGIVSDCREISLSFEDLLEIGNDEQIQNLDLICQPYLTCKHQGRFPQSFIIPETIKFGLARFV